MTFVSIEQLPAEPILLAVFEGEITRADMADLYQAMPSLLSATFAQTGAHVLCDTRLVTGVTFGETLKSLQVAHAGGDLLASLPFPVQFYLVGESPMARLYVNTRRLQQFGGRDVLIFPHMEDALAAARTAITGSLPHDNTADGDTVSEL